MKQQLVQFFPTTICPCVQHDPWRLSRIFPAARTFAWGLVTGYSVFAKIRRANLGWNVSFQVAEIVANFGNSKSSQGISDVFKYKGIPVYRCRHSFPLSLCSAQKIDFVCLFFVLHYSSVGPTQEATAQNGLNLLLIMVTASIKVDDFFWGNSGWT